MHKTTAGGPSASAGLAHAGHIQDNVGVTDKPQTNTAPGEAGLVQLARQGDTDAFSQLVRLHEAAIRRLATGFLGDFSEAEDAAQEVFIKAFKNLGRFRGDSAFSTWLHQITVNHCKDLLRARKRRGWLPWNSREDDQVPDSESLSTAPDEATRNPEAGVLLRQLLKGLPVDYRSVLLLRELQGLSYMEIAETLGISQDAVKARLRRARQTALEAMRHLKASEGV